MQYFFRRIKFYLFLLDMAALNFALLLSAFFFCGTSWFSTASFLSVVVFFNCMWPTLSLVGKAYDELIIQDSTVILRTTYKIYSAFFFCTGLFLFISSLKISGNPHYFGLFLSTSIIFGAILIWLRIVVLGFRKKYRNKIKPQRNIVVLANKQIAEKLYDSVIHDNIAYNLLGIFSPAVIIQNGHPAHILYKGNLDNCIDFIQLNRVQEVYCAIREFSPEQIQHLVNVADKQMIRVRFLLDYEDVIKKPGKVTTHFGDMPVLTLRQEPLEDELNQFVKRAFDIAFSAFVLIFVMSWLAPLLALLIKLESKGPAIFVQLRSGKDNKPFKCYKFRSMRMNNDAHSGLQATKDDKRLTKTGKFIRKTNLDEFPQFYNVLKGDMSIVGPRPHMLAHTKKYKALLGSYMVRHLLKPGITGWAQVNGYRGETKTLDEMKKRVQYDVDYLENWSFFLDLKIIFLTVWNTVKGEEKAY